MLAVSAVCQAQVTTKQTTVGSINVYAAQIDSYVRRHRGRTFANFASEESEADWREFKSAAALQKSDQQFYEEAGVWQKDGVTLAANCSVASPSGDWIQIVYYYFREDGSLAKIQSELNTFHGNLTVIRTKFYDAAGKLLHTTAKYLDLKSRQPTRSRDFMDQEVPVYLRTQDLPFYKLL